jgi:hypothetical protein
MYICNVLCSHIHIMQFIIDILISYYYLKQFCAYVLGLGLLKTNTFS